MLECAVTLIYRLVLFFFSHVFLPPYEENSFQIFQLCPETIQLYMLFYFC